MTDRKVDWTIKPVDVDDDGFNEEEFGIFQYPSLGIGIGSVAAGKSTLMYNLIQMLEPVFKGNVILWSPTIMNDPIGLKMKDEEMFLEHFEEYSNANLEAVLNVIKDDPDERTKYLLVFDDILGMLPKNIQSRDHKYFSHFISTYRHGGGTAHEGQLSLLFFTQYYKDLSPVLRANSSYYFFLGAHSEKHQAQYSEELNAVSEGNSELFLELWKKAKNDNRYNFLTLDMRKLRAYKNLDTLIYERKDENSKDNPANATNTDLVNKSDDDAEGS
jgi:hypothetical protein